MIDHARPRLVGPMTGAISGELAALRYQRKSATSEPKSSRRDKKRNRKVYGITDKGETRLRELSSMPTPPTIVPSTCRSRSAASSNPSPGSASSSGGGPT